MHEAQMHDRSCFLTLTYDDEHLPYRQSLDVSHWQLFAKRLRQKCGPFRFFHCGEYGERTGRPHYHACLFGLDFSEDRKLWKEIRGNAYYVSETLTETWSMGHALIGDLTPESAAYTARYVMKKVTGNNAADHYGRVDEETGEIYELKPEYITMSRNKGLGESWFRKFHRDVYPSDEVVLRGKKYKPPRYYDKLYEEMNPEGFAAIVKRREAREVAANRAADNTDARLEARREFRRLTTSVFDREPGRE